MKKGAFISYSSDDSDKKDLLKGTLEKSEFIYPIIVADYNENMKLLSEKIINSINKADFLIPILTEKSKNNQWVNQEVGYAKCKENDKVLKIFPVVEKELLKNDQLKGFINNQLDLPYTFNNENDLKNFEDCIHRLILFLESEIKQKDKLIKFTGDKRRFIRNDDSLQQFPDRYTRELFGYSDIDIIEIDKSEEINFTITGRIPSILRVTLIKYEQKYYADFNNELKLIPTDATLKHIQELNKSSIINLTELKDKFIGSPLTNYEKLIK